MRFLALFLSIPLLAIDWPQWRGIERNGVSPETGLANSWPAAGPPLVWKAQGLGEGYAAFSIAGGRLFTQGQRGDQEFVLAIDVKTGKKIWEERFEDIRNFEQYLTRNGVVVRKFFLNVSKKEQKQRFLERIEDPLKNWKFSSNDASERDFWDDYMQAYEEMIQRTATKDAPWYVVPADNKWFTRVVVAGAVIETLDSLDLAYPKVDEGKLKELAAAKKKLVSK